MFKCINKWLHQRKATNFLNQFEELIWFSTAFKIDYFGGPEKLLRFSVRFFSNDLSKNHEIDCRLTIIGNLPIVNRLPVKYEYVALIGIKGEYTFEVSINDLTHNSLLRIAKILRKWESRENNGNIILDVPFKDTFEPLYLKGLRNVNGKMCTYTIIEN